VHVLSGKAGSNPPGIVRSRVPESVKMRKSDPLSQPTCHELRLSKGQWHEHPGYLVSYHPLLTHNYTPVHIDDCSTIPTDTLTAKNVLLFWNSSKSDKNMTPHEEYLITLWWWTITCYWLGLDLEGREVWFSNKLLVALCLVGACWRALSLYLLAKLALSVLSPVVSGVLYNLCILRFVEELATKQVVTRNQTMIIQ